jgi:imidazolonepropionase-like amidohydrolase
MIPVRWEEEENMRHRLGLAITIALCVATGAWAQEREELNPAPPRGNQGEGPFERLIIRGATLIDGSGGMPRGPVDIVVEGNRIVEIKNVGTPHVPIEEKGRPTGATKEIDASRSWVLPGFVDIHEHVGGAPKSPNAEYAYKLWMAHGITTIRGVPAGPMNWTLSERERSARNEIVAPRIFAYHRPGQGEDWKGGPVDTPEKAREWVRFAAQKGIDGLKLDSHRPEIMAALLDEAKKHGLGSTAHLSQQGVADMNAIDAVRLGLGTVTHFYGIFESLYDDTDVQPWPVDANYNNEQDRFSQVAMQWNKIHPRGSKEWNALIDELLEHKAILDPTMTAYHAGRDVMRMRQADWHDKYTLPSLWEFYQPSRKNHGSYWYYWTTWEEVAWRNFYRVWMDFLDDYKDKGGRVTVSSDAAFIYNLWGFGSIVEMELLQEAGFHPLEVFRGATKHGAEALFEPKGKSIEFGVVRPGLLADLIVIDENPIANLKVLYGTGAERLNDETGEVERVGGVKYTIKDGIIYDAKELLADVARMVEVAKMQQRPTEAGGR